MTTPSAPPRTSPRAPARRTYLDWNATAPLNPDARAAMVAALDTIGNPSSVHAEGRAARALIEAARDDVAKLIAARPQDVVFTSGASEANATVLTAGWDTILLADIEHDSVLAPARASGARIIKLPVDPMGRVRIDAIADAVLRDNVPLGRALISIQLANNETGVLQDVAAVAAVGRAHGLAIHTDAVQAPGRIPIDVAALDVDYLTLSAHKLGGPKGVGALVVRDGAPLRALVPGGGQERRRRGGTENVVGIAGFAGAARTAAITLASVAALRTRRDRLEADLMARVPTLSVVGAGAPRLPNTSCLLAPGKSAETLVIRYDLAGVAISAGSACSSGKLGASHVLTALGLAPDLAKSAIRVSLGPTTTDDDIAAFLAASETILRRAAIAA